MDVGVVVFFFYLKNKGRASSTEFTTYQLVADNEMVVSVPNF